MSTTALCQLTDIPAGQAKSFQLERNGESVAVFIAERNGHYFGYVDSCPHTGIGLPWNPDDYFDRSGQYLMCAMHGALFRVEDGRCIAGPCTGESLAAVPLIIRDGHLYLDEAEHD